MNRRLDRPSERGVALLTVLPPYLPEAHRTALTFWMPIAGIFVSLSLGAQLLRYMPAVQIVLIGLKRKVALVLVIVDDALKRLPGGDSLWREDRITQAAVIRFADGEDEVPGSFAACLPVSRRNDDICPRFFDQQIRNACNLGLFVVIVVICNLEAVTIHHDKIGVQVARTANHLQVEDVAFFCAEGIEQLRLFAGNTVDNGFIVAKGAALLAEDANAL